MAAETLLARGVFTACLLWAAKPWPCGAGPFNGQCCLLAPITISCSSPLHSRLPTQTAPRTGQSEQHLIRDAAGLGWDIAPRPRNGTFTCPPQTPQHRLQECIADSPQGCQTFPGGTRLEAAVGYTQLAISHACFQP